MYTKNVDKNYSKTPNIFLPIFILKGMRRSVSKCTENPQYVLRLTPKKDWEYKKMKVLTYVRASTWFNETNKSERVWMS